MVLSVEKFRANVDAAARRFEAKKGDPTKSNGNATSVSSNTQTTAPKTSDIPSTTFVRAENFSGE